MNESFFHGASVLVTGASGFIGSHLTKRLSALGAEVHGTSRQPRSTGDCLWHPLSLERPDELRSLLVALKPQVTFHLAARMERDRVPELITPMLTANTLSVGILCEQLASQREARLVIVGSGEDYGISPGPWTEQLREQPVSPYGVSKVAGAAVVAAAHAAFGLRAVTARPSVVYGPEQHGNQFLPSLIAACLADATFAMTLGEQVRDFLYVDDLVDGLLVLAAGDRFGRVFNLCTGVGTRIVDLATRVQELVGRGRLDVGRLPYRSSEAMVQSMDPAAMRESFGWKARISLDEGLRRTIAAARP